jgi:site-specific DNA-adenine methylase
MGLLYMASLFYFRYIGGKRLEVKYIIDYIKELYNNEKINKIVEPFAGSCAVSLHCKIRENINVDYHINDLDDELINFLNYIKLNGSKKLLKKIKKIWFDNDDKSPEYFNSLAEEYKNDENRYDLKILLKKITYLGNGRTYYENNAHNKFNVKDYSATDNFFINAEITQKDYTEIFEKYKNDKKALLFLDPPYLDSCNKDYKTHAKRCGGTTKTIKDNTMMYVDIRKYLDVCKCKVIMIINDNAINQYIYKDFIKSSYEKIYQRNKVKTRHLVISNF